MVIASRGVPLKIRLDLQVRSLVRFTSARQTDCLLTLLLRVLRRIQRQSRLAARPDLLRAEIHSKALGRPHNCRQ